MRLRTVQMTVALALVASVIAFGQRLSGQSIDPTFQFHGNVPVERQADIRTDYSEVSEWFETSYDIETSGVSIHIGADSESIVKAMRSTGRDVEDGVAPCFWGGGGLYFLVDLCESPLPFARLHMHEAMAQLARNPGGLVERDHHHAGPYWLFHGSEEFAESAFLISSSQTSIETIRAQRLADITDVQFDLSNLETSVDFWPFYRGRSVGWLALDYLTTRAGPNSYIKYFRQRAISTRWEDAFQAAFRLPVEEFYEQFPAYRRQLQQAQREQEASALLHRWWNAARESGRTQQIDVPAGGRLLAWYGINAPLAWFFETYPSVGLVLQWSAAKQQYLGAIREVPSTHSAIPEIRRNSVIYVSTGANRSMPLEVPTPVQNRIELEPGGDFVPWLGADAASFADIAAATGASEVTLVRDSRSSQPQDADQLERIGTADNGNILWIVTTQPRSWIQSPIEPRPAVDAEGTIALLENPEASEIADAEFEIIVAGGTVTAEDQAVVRARLADSIAFLRERYDTPMRLFDVQLYGDDHEERPGCGNAAPNHIVYRFWCRGWTVTGLTDARANSETLTHEYFHYLQRYWNPRYQFGAEQFPIWLSEGAAFYSEAAYWAHRGLAPLEATFDERAERARGASQPLSYFVDTGPWRVGDQSVPLRYQLAFLAVSRLVQISGNPDSWIEFWYPWNGRDRWDVFEDVFGISIEDFYVEFEAWRAEHYPPHN